MFGRLGERMADRQDLPAGSLAGAPGEAPGQEAGAPAAVPPGAPTGSVPPGAGAQAAGAVAGHLLGHVQMEPKELPGDAVGQRLFSVWHRLRDRAGRVPLWLDLEALGVPDAAGGAILAAPQPEEDGGPPQRFLALYVGREVQQVWGEDFTGQVMYSDVFPEMYEAIACGIRSAHVRGRPLAAEYRVQIAYRISYLGAVFLPFLGPGEGESRVLAHLNFSHITIRDAQDWRGTLETQERIQRLLDGRIPD